MSRIAKSSIAVLGLMVLFSALSLFAQSDNASISGFVKDASGASIPNATVVVKNEGNGVERRTTTNTEGFYIVTNLPPATYTVRVDATGFRTFQQTGNKLNAGIGTSVDATLQVGAVTQTVEVSASVAALQSESATVGKLVDRFRLDALELNGRNPVNLAALSPGIRGGTLANLSAFLTQGPSNFNGSRNPENLITFDGAPATRTRSNGTSIGAADVDSTQEVQILGADYSPEYGRSSGGQIRIISRSGTSDFHGGAYEYFRNDALNSNTWVRNSNASTAFTSPFHYNQFGYNIAGPFYIPDKFNTNKSKYFFYWGEEWIRYHFTETNSLTVPSAKMRTGDFSELLDPTNFFYRKTVVIKNPATGLPYPGNIITNPSANGLGILNAWPIPNLATPINGNQNWFAAKTHTQHQRKDTLTVDANLTEKQRVRFTGQNYAFLEYQPLDGGTDRTPKFFNRPNQTSTFSHVWNVSANKVNELLLTASEDVVLIPVDTANFFDRTKAGLNYNYIFPQAKLIPTRIPTVNMSPFSGLSGGPYPSHSSGPIFDASDSFTLLKGSHTIKFGYLYEYSGENDNDEINVQACSTCTNNQNGQFLFTDGRSGGTGNGPGNAALGLFDTYSEIGQRAYTIFRGSMHEAFVQDAWKATPKLHVDYGVRYSVIVPYHAQWGDMVVFDPRFYDPSKAVQIDSKGNVIPGTGDPYNGMVIPGSGWPSSAQGRYSQAFLSQFDYLHRGVSNHYSDIRWEDIQPRLGFAYRLGEKNVVRAGAGRFFTRLGVSDSVFLGGDPPFQPNASLTLGTVDTIAPPSGTASPPLVVTTQSIAFKNPEAWAWNATFEREMPGKTVLSVAYVGRRGLHLQREANINQPTTAVRAANPGVNINALRPYKGFGSIRQTDNVASSIYHSLQVNVTRRFTNGLAFGAAYTYSKSMDNGSNQRDVVPNTYDVSPLWGPSEFDTRHILVVNYIYQLPFLRGRSDLTGKLAGGWQVSGIAQWQTGTPCGVAQSKDFAGVGLDSNFGCGTSGQYWVVNGTPKIMGTFGTTGQWFDTTPFSAPPAGTFNTQRVRDLIYQPGFRNWNVALFKSFPINESKAFQFRAEAYNVLNHPNWGGPSGGGVNFNPASGTFGKVTSKGGSPGQGNERNLQLSLRFYF